MFSFRPSCFGPSSCGCSCCVCCFVSSFVLVVLLALVVLPLLSFRGPLWLVVLVLVVFLCCPSCFGPSFSGWSSCGYSTCGSFCVGFSSCPCFSILLSWSFSSWLFLGLLCPVSYSCCLCCRCSYFVFRFAVSVLRRVALVIRVVLCVCPSRCRPCWSPRQAVVPRKFPRIRPRQGGRHPKTSPTGRSFHEVLSVHEKLPETFSDGAVGPRKAVCSRKLFRTTSPTGRWVPETFSDGAVLVGRAVGTGKVTRDVSRRSGRSPKTSPTGRSFREGRSAREKLSETFPEGAVGPRKPLGRDGPCRKGGRHAKSCPRRFPTER